VDAGSEVFMRRAIALSREKSAAGEGGPFGAVVVRGGAIIGEGWNQVLGTNDPTAHAEIVAIRRACAHRSTFSLDGCEIYTSCEPCPMCLAAILWARIGRIYYANTRVDAAAIGFDDDYFYREVAKPMDRLDVPASRLLPEEARAVFGEWDARPDKVRY
jgi:tRNA(Arg) A34 adenosine deaminase TadA